ncbi:MAG TPA: hypothetical protein PKX91_04075 [Clostridia bacterium]|jgi:hypothetical protein|nr:hypothetical protein [Clostridia bacterium]
MEKMYTLARGGRARVFGYEERQTGVVFYTGKEFSSIYGVSNEDLNKITEHFQGKGWFILGNQVDDVKPNGLGEYFEIGLGIPAKLASHVGAYLVKKGKLLFRDDFGKIEFKVK